MIDKIEKLHKEIITNVEDDGISDSIENSVAITKDIAIKFAEFITNKNWKEYIDINTEKETKIYWCQYKNLDEYYTTEELFNIFIRSL